MNNCEEGKYSAVVMDPPRAGSTKEFIAALEKISPRQIVYISCDPVTLARDLGYFTNYEIKRVIPVDMFPHTFHVETVVLLSRKNGEKRPKIIKNGRIYHFSKKREILFFVAKMP